MYYIMEDRLEFINNLQDFLNREIQQHWNNPPLTQLALNYLVDLRDWKIKLERAINESDVVWKQINDDNKHDVKFRWNELYPGRLYEDIPQILQGGKPRNKGLRKRSLRKRSLKKRLTR